MTRHDAIVIGANVGGLAAAAYLARAGQRVLVLEEQSAPPEPLGPVQVLDPVVLSELKLVSRGLRFVNRDLPLALPGLILHRDRHAVTRALGAASESDARNWFDVRRTLLADARVLRRWWWSALEDGSPDWVLESERARRDFARLSLTGADVWAAAHVQSEALIAALLFDATAGGLHVSEPGSALALHWRAAQEMAGLQDASAMLAPGTLVWSLIKAAADADFRCYARVTRIITRGGEVAGVRLAQGEEIETRHVFSSLSRHATALLLDMPPPAASATGAARLLLTLRSAINFPPVRLILAERPEIYADAQESARAGRLPTELPMEMTAVAPDKIAVTLRPVPAILSADDRVQLAARAVQALSRQVPGAAALVSGVRFAASAPHERATLAQLLAPAGVRIRMQQRGVYLCGALAEPLPSLSGRAARIAVALALKDQK